MKPEFSWIPVIAFFGLVVCVNLAIRLYDEITKRKTK